MTFHYTGPITDGVSALVCGVLYGRVFGGGSLSIRGTQSILWNAVTTRSSPAQA